MALKSLRIVCCIGLLSAATLFAQTPRIADNGVLNAASFVTLGDLGHEPTPGSLIAIFGENFSSTTTVATAIPLPLTLDGVSVTVNGQGAPLLAVTPNQINAQVPWSLTSSGTVSVVVTRQGASSSPEFIRTERTSPAIFTLTQDGVGPAVAVNVDGTLAQSAEVWPHNPSRPARRGEAIILYGNGLGAVSPTPRTGDNSVDQLRSAVDPPRVLVGGIPAEVVFAGLSPEFVGVNQINVIIPEGVTGGDRVAVQLETDSNSVLGLTTITSSALVTIAVERRGSPTNTAVTVTSDVIREMPDDIMGHTVYWPYQPYFWDFDAERTTSEAARIFDQLNPGIVGHYPGVGVITHDFHWQDVIGPVSQRRDPTPRQSSFDTPLGNRFGPDEYGAFIEDWRERTGRDDLESSIQVNVMTGTAEEAADWVEYMNAPNDGSNPGGGTDWASVRAANGHPEPYNIHYWELGNEPHFTASRIGSLTAWEYVRVIQAFVPAMKERDPSIRIMAYVNPFEIRTGVLGEANPDTPAGPAPPEFNESNRNLTWSQAVIKHGGPVLDMLYFHWYSAWNMNRSTFEFTAMTPRTGLIPWLDRLQRDIENFAPDAETRQRLSRSVAVPEWNSYGGWFNPLRAGAAIHGAVASSRVLHVFTQRPEVIMAQRFGLAAPYPNPPMNVFSQSTANWVDIRDGYFAVLAEADGGNIVSTALFKMHRLWEEAFEPISLRVRVDSPPRNAEGVSWLDVTAMRSDDGSRLNLVFTNAYDEALTIPIKLEGYRLNAGSAAIRTVEGDLLDNNSFENKTQVEARNESYSLGGDSFQIELPPYSVVALEATGEVQ